jgi:hypothetical protein
MTSTRFILTPLLVAVLAAPASGLAASSKPACATTGVFSNPDACECPPGYGKLLQGNGGGECKRKICPNGVKIDPAMCDCAEGQAVKKTKKGPQCVPVSAGRKA